MNALMTIETLGKPAMALEIPKKQTFDQWVEMGRELAEGQKVINWWIGDWWIAGERKYGEAKAASVAMEIFGKEYDTVRKCGWVSANFESVRRRTDLPFSAHEEVVTLPPKEQDRIFEKARQNGLSTREIRVEAIKRKTALGLFKPRDQSEPDPEYSGFVNIGRAWNREQPISRHLVAESLEEMGAIRIVDASKLGDIPL